ncbi:sulfite oxidase-like oxidoreductase [Halorubrum distributum JCM 9100]|uniref:Sulfite oxidase-like oxidoreductase n=4 Tax=Halorubrum distributum TaxID=29283 RepID=M0EPB8_9EURY|nr:MULTISPECIES: molybdopterin-dependent oxidoreductase [Halorubrum distributum group]PHQ46971.1 sulfite oxidase-like oxidoreductase [Halorubrum sp. C3]ELZ31701.1 sulfite oxidase-like oxidoreductase [Halorubrum terrestre JCM 10247]ELZ48767.1 sulfite oxidase-like oxidoreductase [Halorubrum distributum JCM 9100]ELZ51880.1 sulfite oxidase-like oxidoreductase [Halorubrum distributum JCM 10118]MYL16129.1 molybdopterin-dependent oxidoreductase [Halorubrum terrestre]
MDGVVVFDGDDPNELADAPTSFVIGSGGERRAVDAAACADRSTVTREYTIRCATGERTTASWTGVPVTDLLDIVDAPAETTHFRVESEDGYAICVPVADALDGVVAFERDGEQLRETRPYALRFLAGDIDGERLVKGIHRIDLLSLPADADPDRYETVTLDNPEYE